MSKSSKKNKTCPVCKNIIEPKSNSCSRCGFNFIGKTESFDVIKINKADQKSSSKQKKIPSLIMKGGQYSGETFKLNGKKFSIGREPSCDIFLSNMTVSRLHASIVVGDTIIKIKDESSLNGTWVNNRVIDSCALSEGDRIQIGIFEMVLSYM